MLPVPTIQPAPRFAARTSRPHLAKAAPERRRFPGEVPLPGAVARGSQRQQQPRPQVGAGGVGVRESGGESPSRTADRQAVSPSAGIASAKGSFFASPEQMQVTSMIRLASNQLPGKAERAGFEPAVRFDPHTAFPVPHLRPLGHLSEELDFLSLQHFWRSSFVNQFANHESVQRSGSGYSTPALNSRPALA